MFGWSSDDSTQSALNETIQPNATVDFEIHANETVAEIVISVLNETLVNKTASIEAEKAPARPSAGSILYQLFGTLVQVAANQTREEPEDFPDFDYFDYTPPSHTTTVPIIKLTRKEAVSF